MKKLLLTLAVAGAIVSCSTNDETTDQIVPEQQTELLSKSQINNLIKESLESSGDFNWMDTNAQTIWSAIQHGDNLLTIGYGGDPGQFQRNAASSNIKDNLINLVRSMESNDSTLSGRATDNLYVDENINVIDIKVENIATIEALLSNNTVRYLEPASYTLDTNEGLAARSGEGFGCGFRSQNIASSDYRTVSPAARVPWNFDIHNIPAAWNYSTGRGVTVAVIDSGLSPEQRLMNQNFNTGQSSGRTVQKFGTYIDSIWPWSNNYDGVNDKCGHGTNMASVATAPRNGNNLPVGVAYNANLVTYRAVQNVLIDDYHEKRGVAEALTALGNRSDVKVISMSIGSPFGISRVRDAIKYAYNRGKMIIAAGGTSTSFTTWFGVIFPANMNETVAVTGLKEGRYVRCGNCHSGSKIDFTIEMERNSGNFVPVLSSYNGAARYVGGSSVATATTAGIAALVWSKNPTWTRAQVLDKMKRAGEFYPNRNSNFGYGNIDALKAVR
ncbi:S8 family peptidase [Tenacibaculum jejuense]|uniref:Peptidase S8 and S53, subtilisin, kexin, sedolisin n=1 Tax=Tenacibaculum jejuense TaxID=584609 RepID=A0A238UBX7_9FLAO|nr:S8/S53 family peptidase [Tenacibaculum jejuense]SNR16717.1 Peptidase S8 and S53, subtilisin, kexin, sedolisin [Tenacibaculum jejuense]